MLLQKIIEARPFHFVGLHAALRILDDLAHLFDRRAGGHLLHQRPVHLREESAAEEAWLVFYVGGCGFGERRAWASPRRPSFLKAAYILVSALARSFCRCFVNGV